jgi:uncharacterized protein
MPSPIEIPTVTPAAQVFVDTNVFLRFLTNDVPEQATAVEKLLRRAAAGDISLVTNSMVIAELVWVLESYYGLPRTSIQESAMAVAHMDGLTLPEIDLVTEALIAYGDANIDYIDAYNAVWMADRGLKQVLTFDKKHYARMEGLEVLVP